MLTAFIDDHHGSKTNGDEGLRHRGSNPILSPMPRKTVVIAAAALVLSCGCESSSDDAGAAGGQVGAGGSDDCLEAIGRDAVDDDGNATYDGVITRMEVRALQPGGCVVPGERIAAMNWFSYADEAMYQQYGAGVLPLVIGGGGKLLVSTAGIDVLEAPSGGPSTGGAYVHDNLAIAWYASPSSFLDMITSPAYQELLPLQQGGASQGDYVFGFQHCFVGCSEDAGNLPETTTGLLLVHHFQHEAADLESAVQTLASASGSPRIVFAAQMVARWAGAMGEMAIDVHNPFWGDATVVYEVESKEAAETWLATDEVVAFRSDASEEVLALMTSMF